MIVYHHDTAGRLYRGLLVLAVAAAELQIELRGYVNRRVGETGKLTVFGCDLHVLKDDDRRQRPRLAGDQVLRDQPLFVVVEATHEPVDEPRLTRKPDFLRELVEIRLLGDKHIVGRQSERSLQEAAIEIGEVLATILVLLREAGGGGQGSKAQVEGARPIVQPIM